MKRLTLKKDVLAELSTDELTGVVAGTTGPASVRYCEPVTITVCTVCTIVPTLRSTCPC